MNKTKLNKLWGKVCSGDKKSIDILYHHFAEQLYLYGLKFTIKSELIEDVIQDLFVHIFNNHQNLNRNVNVKPYLLSSFRHNLFRLLAREKRYYRPEDDNFLFEVTFSIERQIMASEEELWRKKKLVRVINQLTPRQKEMIYLRFTKGLEYTEIADVMSMKVESVRNAMCRSIKALRGKYETSSAILFNLFLKKDLY